MSATNDLNGLFKKVYGDGTIKAVPKFAKLMQEIPFSQQEKLGDMYEVPVLLQHEHGFSYGAHGDGAFTLNAAVAGSVQKAQVRGSMIVLRSRLSYEDVYKASQAGAAAFESATSLVVDNMQRSFAKRLELSFLYGQRGLGTVGTFASHIATISDATWAPGIWSAMKDCVLSSYTGVTGSDTAHDAASGTGTTTGLIVSAVDVANKQINFGTSDSTTVAGDVLSFFGSRTASAFKECAGIDKIMSNTGTLFNISASVSSGYELWKANSRAVGGAISMLAIQNGVADAVNMGLMEDAKVYLATKRWNALNSNEAALRRYGSYSQKAENGSESIVYHSANGANEMVAHPFVKEGEAFLVPNPKKRIKRVGASDVTFRRPGKSEEIFLEVPDVAGLELRAFADQAIVIETPAQCTKYTGITD